jgi:hypothetical protein
MVLFRYESYPKPAHGIGLFLCLSSYGMSTTRKTLFIDKEILFEGKKTALIKQVILKVFAFDTDLKTW